jgi:hypothetical protein
MTPTAMHTRPYPKLIKPTEQEAAYRAALELVARIDEDLTRGVRHYRTKAGCLLVKLDEIVRAIIDNDLLWPDEEEAVIWVRPEGLAA